MSPDERMPENAVSLADPRETNDDLSLEELATRYNFRQTSQHARVFTRLVMKECQRATRPVRALDIGCGQGIARHVAYQWAIREHVDDFWGLEPDATRVTPKGLFDHHVTALMEDADLPESSFDLVYAYMVMEHVEHPDAFMEAVRRVLKPGGVFLFLTPNRRHYFTRIASLMRKLRLDEVVLRLVRGKQTDEYHYPVQYRFNDERTVRASGERLGFEPPVFAYLEMDGPRVYMPGPLRPVFHLLAWKRSVIRNPRSLVALVCRMSKRAG